jgi:integrase
MASVPTRLLKLLKEEDGYYRTRWYDETGNRHRRSFGRHRAVAANRFAQFYGDWKADPRVRNPSLEAPLTISHLWQRYKTYAEAYYRHADGTPTGEALNVDHAMRPVVDQCGELFATDFGPKLLTDLRGWMIEEADWSLNVINQRVNRIRRVFKWAVVEQLIPAEVWHGLQAVTGLRAGRSQARMTNPVRPVPEEYIQAVLRAVPPTVAAMIQVQYHSGARPGEVCAMRPMDLTMAGDVWEYRPPRHKTAHYNKERIILLGPQTQRILQPFLKRELSAYIFDPREAMRQRFSKRPTHRHQPVVAPASTRRVGECYAPGAYANAIRYACRALDIPEWSPNQLRHNAATRVRQRFGLDVAQVVLGHARADVTQLYAEADLKKALAAVESMG